MDTYKFKTDRITYQTIVTKGGKKHFVTGYISVPEVDLVNDIGITNANVRGVSWGTEITIRAERKGYKIKEFPVNWLEGKKSEIKILEEGIKIIKYLFNLRLRLL